MTDLLTGLKADGSIPGGHQAALLVLPASTGRSMRYSSTGFNGQSARRLMMSIYISSIFMARDFYLFHAPPYPRPEDRGLQGGLTGHFAPPARHSAFLLRLKILDIDDIIARDDADELSDFMSRAVCSCSMSSDKRQAIVRFRNHVIEISAYSAPTIKIDGVDLDAPSHPAITNLLISLVPEYQPAQSA
ncbi:hypothetical protein [Acetobacter senegalensis]|uniref:hypothetical protein n=1 Tax=Acetobacter senegalensis TaxID=446692 RepID=UPI002656F8D1|nr:hypothetical protein [Acetobacter senegalensis]MDN7350606.1 hypothetical protein [Acetobacter senegalensis]